MFFPTFMQSFSPNLGFPLNQTPPYLIFGFFVGFLKGFVFASDGSESAKTARNLPEEPGIKEKLPAGGKIEALAEYSRARGGSHEVIN